MEDLCEAITTSEMDLDDLVDKVFPFSQAEEALQFIWEGRQVGKVVLQV